MKEKWLLNSFPNISQEIWEKKYCWKENGNSMDNTIRDTFRRVAKHLAQVEKKEAYWEAHFFDIMKTLEFIPAGRILANAGTGHKSTMLNCFVMGHIEDSIDGIFDALKEGALTMQRGGGVGYDFSTLRPKGILAKSTHRVASGPVSFMHVWNSMCDTLLSSETRRGAMMATLRCDHPDILDFVRAKKQPGVLNHFNLSVLVSDHFMRALKQGQDWDLVFPEEHLSGNELNLKQVFRVWSGSQQPVACRVFKTIPAVELWNEILKSTFYDSEPGILFIDRINVMNNLWYEEQISATNPCGEVPLPAYGACCLGSINLTRFVKKPFEIGSEFDLDRLKKIIPVCVRLLDNVLDTSSFPLAIQEQIAKKTRRIGLGITGLADTLIMLNLHYGQDSARKFTKRLMQFISQTTYKASVDLAQEKGVFPDFNKDKYLQGTFIRSLPYEIKNEIAEYGIRNSHLLSIAPAGTISLFAENISSGIEPIFSLQYNRRLLHEDGHEVEFEITDFAASLWSQLRAADPYPETFISAHELTPKEHLLMLATLQPFVDNAISKTINIPEDISWDDFKNVYELAYDLELKGCTTFKKKPLINPILCCP